MEFNSVFKGLNLQVPDHKLHLAVPCVSVWCFIAMWLRVCPFPYAATSQGNSEPFWFRMPLHVSLTQESLPFCMALPVAVTQGLSVSAQRYTSTWLWVSLCPHSGTRPRYSGSLLYPMVLRIKVTQGLSRSLYLANDACLQKTVKIPCVGDRTVTRAPPTGNGRLRGKAELRACLPVRFSTWVQTEGSRTECLGLFYTPASFWKEEQAEFMLGSVINALSNSSYLILMYLTTLPSWYRFIGRKWRYCKENKEAFLAAIKQFRLEVNIDVSWIITCIII
jgi:hypothetical protein